MMQPTYRIAQALHERRAAVGLKKYGEHLTANSPGCMIVHALEEAADLTEYLLAEMQRRSEAIKTLCDLRAIHGGLVPDGDVVADISYVIDLLGGEAAMARHDEILGTVAENATVDPSDEALRVATEALQYARGEFLSIAESDDSDAWAAESACASADRMQDAISSLAAIRAAGGVR